MAFFNRPQSFRAARMLVLLAAVVATHFTMAGESPTSQIDDASNPAKNLARMNCGATIDLVGTDGRIMIVTNKQAGPTALLLDDDTLNYPLVEGDTTFLLSFPRISALDRFTFVNENAAASGEVTVAVSNYRLPANSSRWNPVSEAVPFTGKRLIDLSMLGTEARYVKLSFHVSQAGTIAGL